MTSGYLRSIPLRVTDGRYVHLDTERSDLGIEIDRRGRLTGLVRGALGLTTEVTVEGETYPVDRESAERWARSHHRQLAPGWTSAQLDELVGQVLAGPIPDHLLREINQLRAKTLTTLIEGGTPLERDQALADACLSCLPGRTSPRWETVRHELDPAINAIEDRTLRNEVLEVIDLSLQPIPADPEEDPNPIIDAIGGRDLFDTLPKIGMEHLIRNPDGSLALNNWETATDPIMRGENADGRPFILLVGENNRSETLECERDGNWSDSGNLIAREGGISSPLMLFQLRRLCQDHPLPQVDANGNSFTARLIGGTSVKSAGKKG
jgi:hypothetical protein